MDRDAFLEALQAIEPEATSCTAVTEWPSLTKAMEFWRKVFEESRKRNRPDRERRYYG